MHIQTRLLATLAEAIARQGETPFLAYWREATELALALGDPAPTYAKAWAAWAGLTPAGRALWGEPDLGSNRAQGARSGWSRRVPQEA